MIAIHEKDQILENGLGQANKRGVKPRLPLAAWANNLDDLENLSFKDKLKKEFKENFRLTDGILLIIVAIISGYLVKKIFIGNSNNPVKKFLGEMFLIGVTGFVTNHPDEVKMVQNTLSHWTQKMRGYK